MSRSNPNEGRTPNPATRWFEWNGEHGLVRYWDKEAKKNVDVQDGFTFMLLDQLGSVRGWHDASSSAIYANEVRDTRQEVLIVKAFKGGTLVEGIYRDIKDRVNSAGGQFVANCYIAYKNGGNGLQIGSLRLKGAALRAWMEFSKAHRAELFTKSLKIQGFTEDKKGRITFRMPEFYVASVSAETNEKAIDLDKQLQAYFASYFKRTKREQVETHDQPAAADQDAQYGPDYTEPPSIMEEVPF